MLLFSISVGFRYECYLRQYSKNVSLQSLEGKFDTYASSGVVFSRLVIEHETSIFPAKYFCLSCRSVRGSNRIFWRHAQEKRWSDNWCMLLIDWADMISSC